MTVVIAGCGDLGTEVGLRFAALGRRVIGLRRSIDKLPREIEGQSIDLSVDVPSLPVDTTIVVIAMAPDERSVDGYRAAYVESVRRMTQAVQRDCIEAPRVLFVSSTAVYGVDDGSWVDASTPPDPSTATAEVLREAEETLLEANPAATMLRLGGIYGPGRTRLIDRVREGVEQLHSKVLNQIHRDDAAGAIVHLTTMQLRPETTYIGVDNQPVERRDLVEFLARRLDLPAPPAGPGSEADDESRGKRCDNTRLRESGFVFSYPTYREGYSAVLQGNGIRHP